MARKVVGLDRLEGAGADMQIQLGECYAFVAQPVQQVAREMQPGGGGGDAAVMRRVHGLVALAVLGARRTANVGRQRHLAVPGERGRSVERPDEPHPPQSSPQSLHDLRDAVRAERYTASRLEFAARMPHGEPGPVGQLADEQEFRLAAGATSPPSPVPRPV